VDQNAPKCPPTEQTLPQPPHSDPEPEPSLPLPSTPTPPPMDESVTSTTPESPLSPLSPNEPSLPALVKAPPLRSKSLPLTTSRSGPLAKWGDRHDANQLSVRRLIESIETGTTRQKPSPSRSLSNTSINRLINSSLPLMTEFIIKRQNKSSRFMLSISCDVKDENNKVCSVNPSVLSPPNTPSNNKHKPIDNILKEKTDSYNTNTNE
jgi:hypothetical protein